MIITGVLAFFSVIFGSFIGLYFKPKSIIGTKLLLSFSGAFLLSILFLEFLPEIFKIRKDSTGILIMLGILTQIILEFFSKGIEHGHTQKLNRLEKIPWVLLLSLCIHSFFEGIPLNNQDKLLWGIVIHKIPIAIVVSLLLWETKSSKTNKVFAILVFALMTPLGGFIGSYLSESVNQIVEPLILGILIHISTTIMFESNAGHIFNLSKILTIILAIIVAFLI